MRALAIPVDSVACSLSELGWFSGKWLAIAAAHPSTRNTDLGPFSFQQTDAERTNGYKSYVCPHCNEAFGDATSLETHLKGHLGKALA